MAAPDGMRGQVVALVLAFVATTMSAAPALPTLDSHTAVAVSRVPTGNPSPHPISLRMAGQGASPLPFRLVVRPQPSSSPRLQARHPAPGAAERAAPRPGILAPLVLWDFHEENRPTQRIRSRILKRIREHPGICYRELQRQVGAADGTFAYHIGRLMRAQQIICTRARGRTHVFDIEFRGPKEGVTLTNRERRILDLLGRDPGATESSVMSAFGMSRSGVSHHLRSLQFYGWARSQRMGAELRWYCARGDSISGSAPESLSPPAHPEGGGGSRGGSLGARRSE